MKKIVIFLTCLAIMPTLFAAKARTVENSFYKMRPKCTAYIESDPSLGRYYIGECVFEFNFSAQPTGLIDVAPLYTTYADNPKHYPEFDTKKCSMNIRRERFNFNRLHPEWHTINNNYIDFKKVNNFSIQVAIPAADENIGSHIATAEVVCVGKSKADAMKELKEHHS